MIPGRTIWITACVIAVTGALVLWSQPDVITWLKNLYDLVTNRDVIKSFVASFGDAAPLVFIGIQILQVIFAPIPGEATGFIGGYLFGALQGFIYS
ncbi:MAG TPA: hypothetical protein VLP30_00435, partial [Desulfatirhabdiaceae bacterium]|nr:hypothetical protein [Desulfatirhabdiaceae bacterium]